MGRLTRLLAGMLILAQGVALGSCGQKKGTPLTPVQLNFSWQRTSGPFGGSVWALAIDGNGDVLAGTGGGGVFRSTDNGARWTAVNNSLTNGYVTSLAINGGGHIFAAVNGNAFRSTDNGASWTMVIHSTQDGTFSVRSLTINGSGHVFAGGLAACLVPPTTGRAGRGSVPARSSPSCLWRSMAAGTSSPGSMAWYIVPLTTGRTGQHSTGCRIPKSRPWQSTATDTCSLGRLAVGCSVPPTTVTSGRRSTPA